MFFNTYRVTHWIIWRSQHWWFMKSENQWEPQTITRKNIFFKLLVINGNYSQAHQLRSVCSDKKKHLLFRQKETLAVQTKNHLFFGEQQLMFFCEQQLSAIGQQLKQIFLLIAGTLLIIAVQTKRNTCCSDKNIFLFHFIV